MKTIGLIGGMSWESSLEYYRLINQGIRERLGGQNNARSLMYTVNFAEVEEMQRKGQWEDSAQVMADAARRLESGGADCVLLCTNTMHKVAPAIDAAVKIPLLHIARVTGERIHQMGLRRVGLLGTRFTMEQDFYSGVLAREYHLDVITPPAEARQQVHDVIYNELCQGQLLDSSRQVFKQIMSDLAAQGAQGIILGCTEIPLLVHQEDAQVPLFDTTRIHAEAAVDFALNG